MWAVLVLNGSAPRVKDRLGSPVIIVQVRRTKRSMSSGAENRSRCPLLNLSVPLRPRRDAPSLLLSGFSIELEARIWFAAQQRRDLREMKTRPCAPGKINAPPRLTSQNISPAPFRLFLCGANLSRALTARKKQQNVELSRGRAGFGRFLAAKIEFSYGAVQTVNLLALRLQWFESTADQIAYSQGVTQLSTALLSADFWPQLHAHLQNSRAKICCRFTDSPSRKRRRALESYRRRSMSAILRTCLSDSTASLTSF
jgi:hypothetical protein